VERLCDLKTGEYNSITDVQGIELGHFSDAKAMCGVTAILALDGAIAGVDVRGSAPGTRETDCIHPINLVDKAQAVVLSGGSVYGLAASDGVVRWLSERGLGFPLQDDYAAPIVPAAVLFDLGRGEEFVPPISADWGRHACDAASNGEVSMGSVGAGTGALSGGIKGGFGTASLVLESGQVVAAAVAVNSLGSVINPQTGVPWEIGQELDNEFGDLGKRPVTLPKQKEGMAAKNTTIAVVATDAVLSKIQAQKVAQMAHDGMARAIRPAHTMFDGDTVFCLATGKKELGDTEGFFLAEQAQNVTDLGAAAADCLSRAIIHGILSAKSLGGLTAFADLPLMQE
jgi:L-aminopeptidase/D-esterase-like protein